MAEDITILSQRVAALVQWRNELIALSKTTAELDPLDPITRNELFRLYTSSGLSKKLSIEDFITEISEDFVLGNVPIKFVNISIDYEATGSTISKMIDAINLIPEYELKQGTVYYFYALRVMLTNGSGIGTPSGPFFSVVKEHFAFTRKLEPNGTGAYETSVGAGSGVTLVSGDLYPSFILDSRDFAPIEFDLGNIGSDEINEAVNTSGPYSTPNVTTVVFQAIQDGVEKAWLYLGEEEEIGLTQFDETVIGDYRELTAADVDAPPTNFQSPIYTPDTGSNILMQTTMGNYCNMETPSTLDEFNIEWFSVLAQALKPLPKLGTWARVLWDSTGKTKFPGINGYWLIVLSGTNGTATISIGGNDYLATFGDDLDDTASDFVTTHSAAILSDTGLVATSIVPQRIKLDGINEAPVSITPETGDLDGTIIYFSPIKLDSPEFEADVLFDMFVECDGNQVGYFFRKR